MAAIQRQTATAATTPGPGETEGSRLIGLTAARRETLPGAGQAVPACQHGLGGLHWSPSGRAGTRANPGPEIRLERDGPGVCSRIRLGTGCPRGGCIQRWPAASVASLSQGLVEMRLGCPCGVPVSTGRKAMPMAAMPTVMSALVCAAPPTYPRQNRGWRPDSPRLAAALRGARPAAPAHASVHPPHQRQGRTLHPAPAAPLSLCLRLPVERPPHARPPRLAAVV